jgi:hypothetical protein
MATPKKRSFFSDIAQMIDMESGPITNETRKETWRVFLCIPYSVATLYGTYKYCLSYKAKIYPKLPTFLKKLTKTNFAILSTLHGLALSVVLIGGNVLLTGFVGVFKESQKRDKVLDQSPLMNSLRSINIPDVILLKYYKSMGFQEDTLSLISRDIKNIRSKGESDKIYAGMKQINEYSKTKEPSDNLKS